MTDASAVPAAVPAAAAGPDSQPRGLKAKAGDLGLKVYLKAPAPAQTVLLNGFLKAQPIVAKVSPHTKKLLGGGLGLVLLRQLSRK